MVTFLPNKYGKKPDVLNTCVDWLIGV